jgi:hypothetical protein
VNIFLYYIFIMSKSTCPCEQIYASATSNGSAITISGDLVTANASATASSAVSYADALSTATKDAQQLANDCAQHDADVIDQTLTIVNSRSLIPSNTSLTVGSNTSPYSQVYTANGVILSSNSPGNQVILTSSNDKLYANGAQVYTSADPQSDASANTFYGTDAGGVSTVGINNSVFGYYALANNTTGADNTAIGSYSLETNTTGLSNTAIGNYSLQANTEGTYNTATGRYSLQTNTTGINNTASGGGSLRFNTEGNYNTAVGMQALYTNTTGSNNTASGNCSLLYNTEGNYNTANGGFSLYANTTGINNTASGFNSLYTNTTGNSNTAVGIDALYFNTTGSYNTAINFDSLHSNTTGNSNTAVGVSSLFTNTTGSNNTALGYQADVTSGALTNSTAIGYRAICTESNQIKLGNDDIKTLVCAGALKTSLDATISGVTIGKGSGSIATNTLCGSGALLVNSTGYDNTAIGVSSLSKNTIGHNNTAIGLQSIQINTTGTYNTGVGVNSLLGNTTGYDNTALGVDSLRTNITGYYNTAIGSRANVASDALTNCTSIGYGAICDTSDQITLGNSSVSVVRSYGAYTFLSDRRDKKDVEDLESSLEFIEQLKPVRFNWNMRDGGKVDIPEIGFIAQDLQQVQLDTGMKIPNLVYDVNPEKLEASYGTLLPLLVKSIQELSHDNKKLNAKIQELTSIIQKMKQ